MLADQLVQAARKPNAMQRLFQSVGRAVELAVPFEVHPDVGRIAHAIQRSSGAKKLAVHEFCRVPFKSCWFEWVGPSASFGTEKKIDTRSEEFAPRPDRCGALVEAFDDELSGAMVTFAWSHKQYGVNVSPYCMLFDWAGKRRIPKFTAPMPFDEVRRQFPLMKNDTDEELHELEMRGEGIPNPRMTEMWAAVDKNGVEALNAFKQNALSDIEGEGGFIEGVLAAINSRNLVSVSEPNDMARVNKARRRVGRPELLSFRTVRLSLSRAVERQRSAGNGDPMPLHMVRGHFKVRKSGIYWWSPFWRGDAAAGVVSRKGYEVRA
jgi:hypothetical protein